MAFDCFEQTEDEFVYYFNGSQIKFDDWMSANYPDVRYRWIECHAVSFRDLAAKRDFEIGLGNRQFCSR